MDLYFAQYIAQIGQGSWIDDFSFVWSRRPFLLLVLSIIVVSCILADKKSRKQYVVGLLVAILLFYVCNELLFKHVFTDLWWIRLRPYLAHPEIFHAIGSQISDSSFPSSHTASVVVIMTLWIWRQRRLRWIAVLIWILVGFSRIHNGMHYPTDVLAGAVFGIIYALLWIQASKLIIKKRPIVE